MPLTAFPYLQTASSAPSLNLSRGLGDSSPPRSPGRPLSPIGVSSGWLSHENKTFSESLPSFPSVPRRPGSTLRYIMVNGDKKRAGIEGDDDPKKRVDTTFEKARSEVAAHRRLDFLARRRYSAASFAAESERTKTMLEQREDGVREFERQRQAAFDSEKRRRELELEATMRRQKEERDGRDALTAEEQELRAQTAQVRQALWEQSLKDKHKRTLADSKRADDERKAFLERKVEQDYEKDRHAERGIELRQAERRQKLELKQQAEVEAAPPSHAAHALP